MPTHYCFSCSRAEDHVVHATTSIDAHCDEIIRVASESHRKRTWFSMRAWSQEAASPEEVLVSCHGGSFPSDVSVSQLDKLEQVESRVDRLRTAAEVVSRLGFNEVGDVALVSEMNEVLLRRLLKVLEKPPGTRSDSSADAGIGGHPLDEASWLNGYEYARVDDDHLDVTI